MHNQDCTKCLFYDVCSRRRGCEHYAPCTEEEEQEMLDAFIESEREEYRSQWRAYLPEEFE